VSKRKIHLIGERIESFETEQLWLKILWLINLRWGLLAASAILLVFCNNFKDLVSIDTKPIGIITYILGLANIIFFFYQYYLHKVELEKKRVVSEKEYVLIFIAQVLVDYLCVTILIYNYGFLPVNLAILYLPHLVITSIIFEKKRGSFSIMLLSLLIIYSLIYLRRDNIDENFLNSSNTYIFSSSLTFAVFNTVIFSFVFYLVNQLAGVIVRNRRKLLNVNKQLIKIDKEKQIYTLRATHELKAPFAAIQSYVQVILGGYLGKVNNEVMEILDKINTRCESLSTMIKNIIQLSDLRTSIFVKSDFRYSESLIPFIKKCILAFEAEAKGKGIKIKLETKMKDDFDMKASFGLLNTLFNNLISNALQYSPEKSEIKVKVEELDQKQISVSVKDNGIGILPENLDKIFNEHFRCKNAVEYSQNGNGMGLAIVKEIVRLHAGYIDVKSTIGEGTEFIVVLPIIF